MTRFGVVFCGLAAATSPGWAADDRAAAPDLLAAVRANWSLAAASEFRYFAWESNRGFPHRSAQSDQRGKGSQIYVPFAVQLVGRPSEDLKIEILGRGGWVWSRQRTRGLSGEVSTLTDTVASATFTYYGISGIQPFVSVSFNFPTGRSSLRAQPRMRAWTRISSRSRASGRASISGRPAASIFRSRPISS